MSRLVSVSSGTTLLIGGPAQVYSIQGAATQGGANPTTLALHDCAATADVAAANLVHTFSLPRTTGETAQFSYTFSGALFPAGLVSVVALNSNTADIVIELD